MILDLEVGEHASYGVDIARELREAIGVPILLKPFTVDAIDVALEVAAPPQG